MRRPDFGLDAMLCQRARHPRRAIVGIGRVGQVLQLATAALRKMLAWWGLMPGPMLKRTVFE
jgi:hypothetical protein